MDEDRRTARLTRRQTEVAVLLGRGLQLREIGERLGIARNTVCVHLKRALAATGARNSPQLAAMVAVQRERDRDRTEERLRERREARIKVEGSAG